MKKLILITLIALQTPTCFGAQATEPKSLTIGITDTINGKGKDFIIPESEYRLLKTLANMVEYLPEGESKITLSRANNLSHLGMELLLNYIKIQNNWAQHAYAESLTDNQLKELLYAAEFFDLDDTDGAYTKLLYI